MPLSMLFHFAIRNRLTDLDESIHDLKNLFDEKWAYPRQAFFPSPEELPWIRRPRIGASRLRHTLLITIRSGLRIAIALCVFGPRKGSTEWWFE